MRLANHLAASGILPQTKGNSVIEQINARDKANADRLKESALHGKRKALWSHKDAMLNSAMVIKDKATAKAYATSIFFCHVAPCNDMVQSLMLDALNVLKTKTHIVRFGTKRLVNDITKEIEKRDRYIWDKVKNGVAGDGRQYLMDYFDTYNDECKDLIELMRISIMDYLEKLGGYVPDVHTPFVLATAMLYFAVDLWDTFFDDKKKDSGYDFRPYFAEMDMHIIKKKWQQLEKPVRLRNDIRLDQCPQFMGWFDKFQDKIYSADIINKSGNVAFDLNKGSYEAAEKAGEIFRKEGEEADRLIDNIKKGIYE